MKRFIAGIVLSAALLSGAYASTIYSIQLYTADSLRYAEAFLKRLPEQIRKEAFIYKTDSGLYTVRVWPADSVRSLKGKLKLLEKLGIRSAVVVKTDPEKLKRFEKLRKTRRSGEADILLLLYQTFLANGKLKKALQVALKGTELHPESPSWWERVAQVSRWLGNQKMLLKSLKELVFRWKKVSYMKELYTIALSTQDFKTAERVIEMSKSLNPKLFSPKEVFLLIYTTENPENYLKKVLPIIENSPEALREVAYIYWSRGEPKKAEEIFSKIKSKFRLKPQDYLTLSHIFFTERKYEKALNILKEALQKGAVNRKLLVTLGNLAWTLGDTKTAIEVSKILISKGEGRPDDYLRLVSYFYYVKPEVAFEYALKGWNKFRLESLLLPLLDLSTITGNSSKVLEIMAELPKNEREKLLKNPTVLLLYSSVLSESRRKKEAEELLEKALKRGVNPDILSQYIYTLIDLKEEKKLKEVLKRYRYMEKEAPMAFIAGYLFIQNGKEAFRILREIEIPSNKYDLLLTKADVLELLGKENEAYRIRREVLQRVKEAMRRGELSKTVVESYLRSLMYFSTQPQFEKEFQKYKDYLTPTVAREMYYSYLIEKGRFEKLLFRREEKLKAWIKLSLALLQKDLYSLDKLTEHYLNQLPIRDRVEALKEIKQIGKGVTTAYRGLEENPYNSKLYRQLRDLAVKYSPHYYLDFSYQKRGAPRFFVASNKLQVRLGDSTYGGVDLKNWFLTSKGNVFSEENLYSHWLRLYAKKLFNNSLLSFGINGVKEKNNSKVGFFVSSSTALPHQSELSFKLFRNAPTDISEIAILSCTKTGGKLSLSIPYNNRISLFTSTERDNYSSTDGKSIGKETTFYSELSFRLRSGYPDYLIRFYLQRSIFSEGNHAGSLADRISQYKPADVLPESYYQLGAGISFGSENRFSFVRVWRPFFSADINYSTSYGWGESTLIGIGGSLFGRDSLRFEVQLFKGFKGRGTNGFIVKSGYKLWF